MTREEGRWVLAYSLALVVLTALPYLLGFATQGSEWRFSGFVFGVEDGNSYLAKMRTGADGAWLFRSPYSTISQAGAVAFVPYLLLGKLAAGRGMHQQLVVLFHLARLAAVFVLVPATYSFAALFLSQIGLRRWVTILATAGGGLGWLAILLGGSMWLGSLPLDVISPESFGFLAVLGLPHLILARGLLLIGLTAYLGGGDSLRARWTSALAFLLVGLLQPISLVSGYAVLGAHVALVGLARRSLAEAWTWARRALIAVSLSLPLFAYSVVAFSQDPYLRIWTAQNKILSPHPLHYLLAYGLVLVPAGMEAVRVIRDRDPARLLLAGWAILLPVLAYFPHNVQRRLPDGAWVALLLLAAMWVGRWMHSGPRARWAWTVLVGASLGTSALILLGAMRTATSPAAPAFVPMGQVRAYEWLAANAPAGSVVLSDYEAGNALPAWAPVRVVIGHGPETAGLADLRPKVERLLAAPEEAALAALLDEHGVQYVLVRRASIGDDAFAAWDSMGFEKVFGDAGVGIYDVAQ